RVHDLALLIVNTEDEDHDRARERMLAYLSDLTLKYGELPSLLATRADYVEDDNESERLLLRAFDLAVTAGDAANVREIALSIASLYANELAEPIPASRWLE